MTQKLFCFGVGYSARHLIQHLKEQDSGWSFAGTCRQQSDQPIADVDIHIFDGTSPLTQAAEQLQNVTHMLISIAPRAEIGDPVLHHMRRQISELKNLKWLGYLSTTGVYGDHRGDWVDDNTPQTPSSAKGRQRRDAELAWLKLWHDHGLPVHLFRLGSIYGPGRGHLNSLQAGKVRKIVKQGQYFSRIHVEDIARVLAASMKAPNPGQSYNVVDDQPASTPEVLDYLCDLLGRPHLPPIDLNDADISPMMKMFYSENKRVHNHRITQELGVTLTYPTYKKGFSHLVKSLSE